MAAIGEDVNYVLGGGSGGSQVLPAVITHVYPDGTTVDVQISGSSQTYANVPFQELGGPLMPHTWHYPV